MLLCGMASTSFAQILPAGSLDPSFEMGDGLEANPLFFQDICVQPLDDGKVLIGGDFLGYNGISEGSLVRINEGGSLDMGFANNYPCNGNIRQISLQDDGKILLASVSSCNGASAGKIARLNADGTLDDSFVVSTGFQGGTLDQRALTIAQQGEKVLVGGEFDTYQGNPARFLTRINADGSYDDSFVHAYNGSEYDFIIGSITRIRVQPDMKFLAAGLIDLFGTPTDRIRRYNSDGSPDEAFNANISGLNGGVVDVQILANGQILLLGTFTQFGATPVSRICRINEDGTLDPTFTSGIQSLNENMALPTFLRRMAVQDDGKIVVTGWFAEINGTPQGSVVRLLPNGSIDDDWNVGTGLNYPGTDIGMAADGNIYVVGRFWGFNGASTGAAIRLLSEPLDLLSTNGVTKSNVLAYPNPSSATVQIESDFDFNTIHVYDMTGRLVWSEKSPPGRMHSIFVDQFPAGMYRLAVQGSDAMVSIPIVVR